MPANLKVPRKKHKTMLVPKHYSLDGRYTHLHDDAFAFQKLSTGYRIWVSMPRLEDCLTVNFNNLPGKYEAVLRGGAKNKSLDTGVREARTAEFTIESTKEGYLAYDARIYPTTIDCIVYAHRSPEPIPFGMSERTAGLRTNELLPEKLENEILQITGRKKTELVVQDLMQARQAIEARAYAQRNDRGMYANVFMDVDDRFPDNAFWLTHYSSEPLGYQDLLPMTSALWKKRDRAGYALANSMQTITNNQATLLCELLNYGAEEHLEKKKQLFLKASQN